MTISEALGARAECAPDAPAISASGRPSMTFRDLYSQVLRVNKELNALGIGRNDVVAVTLPNGPEMAAAFLSIASTATCAPLNPAFRVQDVQAYLTRLRARALVVSPAAAEALAPMA